MAWGSGALGVAAVAAAVTVLALNQVHNTTNFVAVTSPLQGNTHVDPNGAIPVAFNQPMDENSVVASIHIQPATSFSTSWNGNTLVITPDHHLAANVPYSVTIDHNTAKGANGTSLQADVTLAFGTAPTPAPSPTPTGSTVPTLVPTEVAPADGDVVNFAPNGSILANGSPSSLPTPTASLPSPTTSAGNSVGGDGLYLFPSSGGSIRISARAQQAAVAPDGKHVAVAIGNSSGGSTLEVVRSDGTHATTLVSSNAPVVAVAWKSSSLIVYATGQTVATVDFNKQTSNLGSAPTGDQIVGLSPNAGYAAVVPLPGTTTADGGLMALSNGNVRQLSGSNNDIVFSADGKWVAWIDGGGTSPQLTVSPTSSDAPSVVPLVNASVGISSPIALNHDGSLVALVTNDTNPSLDVASTSTGALVGTADGAASAIAFDKSDSHLAFTTTGGSPVLDVASVPSESPAAPANDIPTAATDVLTQFIAAQVSGDNATIAKLSKGVSTTSPKNVTRGYLVDTLANQDGTFTSQATLLLDPSQQHNAVGEVDETITLSPTASGGFLVTGLSLGSLHDQTAGPHVIGLTTSRTLTLFVISFDSDLNVDALQGAITLTDASHNSLPVSVHYDPNARTATVTALGPATSHATLTVSTSLVDISGQHLASQFIYSVGG